MKENIILIITVLNLVAAGFLFYKNIELEDRLTLINDLQLKIQAHEEKISFAEKYAVDLQSCMNKLDPKSAAFVSNMFECMDKKY
jgi:uncharacterized protein YxeA